MFSFQGASLNHFFKRLNEAASSEVTSVNLLWVFAFRSGGPRTRFSAEKPRRLQQSTGLFPKAAFRVHFGALPFWTRPSRSWLLSKSFSKWWAKMDSNHRPHDYQSCALASWAIGPYQLHFFLWWRLAGSNRWPPACKAGALPAELNPHIFHQFSSFIK